MCLVLLAMLCCCWMRGEKAYFFGGWVNVLKAEKDSVESPNVLDKKGQLFILKNKCHLILSCAVNMKQVGQLCFGKKWSVCVNWPVCVFVSLLMRHCFQWTHHGINKHVITTHSFIFRHIIWQQSVLVRYCILTTNDMLDVSLEKSFLSFTERSPSAWELIFDKYETRD